MRMAPTAVRYENRGSPLMRREQYSGTRLHCETSHWVDHNNKLRLRLIQLWMHKVKTGNVEVFLLVSQWELCEDPPSSTWNVASLITGPSGVHEEWRKAGDAKASVPRGGRCNL